METKRREILNKWFAAFQLSIGLPNEPLTDHAAEYLEAAMQEYAKIYHESEFKKLRLSAVSGQSELLIAFADWVFEQPKHLGGRERELVAEYLKVINSH